MKQTMVAVLLCGFLMETLLVAHGSDPVISPVSIKVVQIEDADSTRLQVQVVSSSPAVVIVDREALLEPDFAVAKEIERQQDGTFRSIHTVASHGSVGGRWSLEQLRRREPDRLVAIQPGQNFTMDVPAKKLLGQISDQLLQGTINVRFGFHHFLLCVEGRKPSEELFDATVKAEETKIEWHQSKGQCLR